MDWTCQSCDGAGYFSYLDAGKGRCRSCDEAWPEASPSPRPTPPAAPTVEAEVAVALPANTRRRISPLAERVV